MEITYLLPAYIMLCAKYDLKTKVSSITVLQFPNILCFSFRTDREEYETVMGFQTTAQERTNGGTIRS